MLIWFPGASVSGHCPIYVRSIDTAALLEKLSEYGAPCPRIEEVLPNGEAVVPLVSFLQNVGRASPQLWLVGETGARRSPDPLFDGNARITLLDQVRGARIDEADAEFRPLLRAARDVVISLHACSAASLKQAAHALESAALALQAVGPERCHPLTAPLAKFVQTLAERLILPMEQGFVYHHVDNDPGRSNWWGSQSHLIQTCADLQGEIKSIGAPAPPLVVDNIQAWLAALSNQITFMSINKAGKHSVVFETASAWFTAAAFRHIEQAQSGWGLLFLHRAVEWLLMAKASHKGLIEYTRRGGRYKIAYVGAGDREGFRAHLTVLAGDISLHLMPLLEDLNRWRNLLPYTHHMTVAPDNIAYSFASKILKELPIFADSTRWNGAVKVFINAPPIGLEDLLDPDAFLRSSVKAMI